MPADALDVAVMLARDPVHIVGDPAHDFKHAGLPGDVGLAVLLGALALHGGVNLVIAEDIAAGTPDGEVAVGARCDDTVAGLYQGIVAGLVFLLGARYQLGHEDTMANQLLGEADNAKVLIHETHGLPGL